MCQAARLQARKSCIRADRFQHRYCAARFLLVCFEQSMVKIQQILHSPDSSWLSKVNQNVGAPSAIRKVLPHRDLRRPSSPWLGPNATQKTCPRIGRAITSKLELLLAENLEPMKSTGDLFRARPRSL